MTLLNLMERIGSRNTKLIAAYVNDALNEIGVLGREKISESKIDIVSGVRDYAIPEVAIKVDKVFYLDEDENLYIEMDRITDLTYLEADSVGGSSSESSIIVE